MWWPVTLRYWSTMTVHAGALAHACGPPVQEMNFVFPGKDVSGTFPRKATIQRTRSLVAHKVVTLTDSVTSGLSVRRGLRVNPSNGMFSCRVRGAHRLVGCRPMATMSMFLRWGR